MILDVLFSFALSCQQALIADDPMPFAEEPSSLLLEFECIDPIRQELQYRFEHNLLTPSEVRRFQEVCV